MKAFFLLTILALNFNVFANDELPMIEDQADEEALAVTPDEEPVAVVAEEVSTKQAAPQPKIIQTAPINVDGYMKQEKPQSDRELEEVRSEISRQKKEIVLNKVKAQEFKQLGKSTEALSETTEDMLLEKRAAQEEIANYNKKVQCMQSEHPGPECDKFVRKRR
jgi:hypothetical protein